MSAELDVERIYAPVTGWDGNDGLLAIVVRAGYRQPGVTFFSDREQPQQLGCLCHPAGHVVGAHTHRQHERVSRGMNEVLFVRRGKVKLTLFTSQREHVGERTLGPGDCVQLIAGGHGLEVLEEAELLEVKVGPYLGRELDKVSFEAEARHASRRAP